MLVCNAHHLLERNLFMATPVLPARAPRLLFVGVTSLALFLPLLSGCGTAGRLREHIRARDYRAVAAAREQKPAASPLPNVPDMPGWTADTGMALEFARENSLRTIIFIRRDGHPASIRSRDVLLSPEVQEAIGDSMRVSFDLAENGSEAARLRVEDAPALVILDSAGTPVARRVGPISKKLVLEALRF